MARSPSDLRQAATPGTLCAPDADTGRGRRHPSLPLRVPAAQDSGAAHSSGPHDESPPPPGGADHDHDHDHDHDAPPFTTHIDEDPRPGRREGGPARRAEIADLKSQTRFRRDPTQPPDPPPQTPTLILQLKHLQFLLDPFSGTKTRPTDEDPDAIPAAEAAPRGGGGHSHPGAAAQHQAGHSQLLQQLYSADTPCVLQVREPPRAAALQEEGPHAATAPATEGLRPHPTRTGRRRDRNGGTGDRHRLHQRDGCTSTEDARASSSSGPGRDADAAPAAAAAGCEDAHDEAPEHAGTDTSSGVAGATPDGVDRADTIADPNAATPADAPDPASNDADAADAAKARYPHDDADLADAATAADATPDGADRADTLTDLDAATPADAPDSADNDADAADAANAGYLHDDADLADAAADAVADAATTRSGRGGPRGISEGEQQYHKYGTHST